MSPDATNMKRVALIPILLGSTRIPDKNLLLVDGRPMAFHVARACKDSGSFDEIYFNSEHDIVEHMARLAGVDFYRRQPQHGGSACTMRNKSRDCAGTRCQTHDHFLYDFMASREPCHLALVHTTSPLLKAETITRFMDTMVDGKHDSFFSIEERFSETFLQGEPLNFSLSRKIPTQTLFPVQSITWALSGWNTAAFMESYRRDELDEKGPTFCGNVGLFPLDRIQALDADTWDELYLIEAALQYRRHNRRPGLHRFSADVVGIEHDLRELIARDGVTRFDDSGANTRLTNLRDIKARMGTAPWLYLLLSVHSHQIALISQSPGEGARKHCHVTHDEWWVVLEGSFEWRLGDGSVVRAGESDVVFLPAGTVHSIVCTSPEPGIRLACGSKDMEHIYVQ
jgi:CMP-N-acetylneuraminic acid synthetase/quercetin dioxygenase-like cupin family protein